MLSLVIISLLIVAYGPELTLLFAVHESVVQQVTLYFLRLGAEVIAECLQRVKLLVAQKHVHARNQYGGVFWQMVHLDFFVDRRFKNECKITKSRAQNQRFFRFLRSGGHIKKVIFENNRRDIRTLICNFAAVNQKTRRYIASWVLLAVFLPMLVLSSLHVHGSGVTASATECADCVHHSCHGHMIAMSHWTHDCVLCQFLTLTFLTTETLCLIIINKVAGVRIGALKCSACVAHSGIVGLRAPPAFSI